MSLFFTRSCGSVLCALAMLLVGCGRGDQGGSPQARQGAAAPAAPAGVPATNTAIQQQPAEKTEVAQQGGRLEVKLDFSSKPFTDADLANVPLNDAVTEINLSGTQITDAGLIHLKKAPNLITVNLDDTKITDQGLEHLLELPKLQWVELMGNPQISTAAYDKLQKVLIPRRPGS